MTEATLKAVILRLQSSAVECFEVIKARCAGELNEGDVDFIAQQGMRLANLEGAIITLQQYAPAIEAYAQELELSKARAIIAAQQEVTPPPANTAEVPKTDINLEERSPTYRRSMAAKKKATKPAKRTKRTKKDE